jgi:hypothetical protein
MSNNKTPITTGKVVVIQNQIPKKDLVKKPDDIYKQTIKTKRYLWGNGGIECIIPDCDCDSDLQVTKTTQLPYGKISKQIYDVCFEHYFQSLSL